MDQREWAWNSRAVRLRFKPWFHSLCDSRQDGEGSLPCPQWPARAWPRANTQKGLLSKRKSRSLLGQFLRPPGFLPAGLGDRHAAHMPVQPWGLQSTAIGAPIPHQACKFGIVTLILMVTKVAQGSDMTKVTQPERGRVGLNTGPNSRPAFCPYVAGPPKFLLSSPHNRVGEGWEVTGK